MEGANKFLIGWDITNLEPWTGLLQYVISIRHLWLVLINYNYLEEHRNYVHEALQGFYTAYQNGVKLLVETQRASLQCQNLVFRASELLCTRKRGLPPVH
jgi:hypothetical protein